MKLTYNPQEPERIDKYLANTGIPELFSRSLIEKLITDGKVTVNEKCVKKRYLLQADDIIDIELPEAKKHRLLPEEIPLDIVYEDEYFAVINKEPGISVHPSPGNYQGTIVNALLNHFGDNLANSSDEIRPGLVHRLDKNTSGLMLIAKNDKTLYLFNKMFADRKIKKMYKAILIGIPSEESGTISTGIARSNRDRTKMTVSSSGKDALTDYTVEKNYTYFSLVDILLRTGRTHQIRVHFNHINCPVMGDDSYGFTKLKSLLPLNQQKKVTYYIQRNLKRQALHSYKLEFTHPVTSDEISIAAPLPQDMSDCLDWLEKNYLT